MYGNNGEDSPMNDVIGVIGASAFKYLFDSFQKYRPDKVFPQLVEGIVGVSMLGGRHYIGQHPTAQAVMEASGYTLTSAAIGTYLASNTVTLGNIAAGSIPTRHISTTASPVRRMGAPVIMPPAVPQRGTSPQGSNWNSWNELGYTG
jgi:hypothetical protein